MDALAPSRGDANTHEATRRILSVLLQRLEGFQGRSENIVICATNRKQDLDAALLSRFNVTVKYNLPDKNTRVKIFELYAKQLSHSDREKLAERTDGFSCRAIKDFCEQVERKFASSLLSGNRLGPEELPSLKHYDDQLEALHAQQSPDSARVGI